jgi:hypothetical protein
MTRADKYLGLYEGFRLGSLGKSAPKTGINRFVNKVTKFEATEDKASWTETFDEKMLSAFSTPIRKASDPEERLYVECRLSFLPSNDGWLVKLTLAIHEPKNFLGLQSFVPKTLRLSETEMTKWIESNKSRMETGGLVALRFPEDWEPFVKYERPDQRPYVKGFEQTKLEELVWTEYPLPSLDSLLLGNENEVLAYIRGELTQVQSVGEWHPILDITAYIRENGQTRPRRCHGFKHKKLHFPRRKDGREWIQGLKEKLKQLGLAAIDFPNEWEKL